MMFLAGIAFTLAVGLGGLKLISGISMRGR
jgi:hypothetical protein